MTEKRNGSTAAGEELRKADTHKAAGGKHPQWEIRNRQHNPGSPGQQPQRRKNQKSRALHKEQNRRKDSTLYADRTWCLYVHRALCLSSSSADPGVQKNKVDIRLTINGKLRIIRITRNSLIVGSIKENRLVGFL